MKCFFIFFSCIATHPLFAQQGRVNITGTVAGKTTQQPIEFVTVILLDAKDSSLIKGSITDKKGKFVIDEILPGRYFIRFSYIGYADILAKELSITG